MTMPEESARGKLKEIGQEMTGKWRGLLLMLVVLGGLLSKKQRSLDGRKSIAETMVWQDDKEAEVCGDPGTELCYLAPPTELLLPYFGFDEYFLIRAQKLIRLDQGGFH